jgi:OmpA-OmpF porin, OOP family
MANLLDSLKEYVTPELIGKAAEMLGENESGISKALGGMAPTILSGLLSKSSDSAAMGGIFNQLSNFDSGILGNLGSLLGGGNLAHNDPKDVAGNLMGSLFGSKVPAVLNALASFAGIKSSSVSSLLGVAGPMVMGLLSKRIKSDGLNVSGLANLLLSEKSSIMGALPAGLGSVMGFADMGGSIGGATRGAAVTGGNDDNNSGGGMNWLWPILALVALGLGAMYYMKNCSGPKVPEVKVEIPTIDSTAIKARLDSIKNAAAFYMKKLASGFELKGNANGIESQLVAFIEDAAKPVDKTTWFNFDRLTFKTGSADIDMEKSKDQLTNIYEVLKAYPKVKLKVGGYTDNVGKEESNMKLSAARAKATVAALEGMGVEKGRLAPEGYGSQHPVASNDTEEGRAQNRRISVRVTEK